MHNQDLKRYRCKDPSCKVGFIVQLCGNEFRQAFSLCNWKTFSFKTELCVVHDNPTGIAIGMEADTGIVVQNGRNMQVMGTGWW